LKFKSGVYFTVLSGLIAVVPLAGSDAAVTVKTSPSGSESLTSTLMSTAVSSLVVALSSFACAAASWVIVILRPATVSEPARAAPVVFGATVKLTVPLPLPGVPESIVIKASLLTACQSQAAVADKFFVTVTVPVLPGEKKAWGVGDTVVQEAGIVTLNAPRPWVKANNVVTPLLLSAVIDSTTVFENPVVSRAQLAPLSSETNTPKSVPT